MDLRDDWIKVNETVILHYELTCPKCSQKIVIEQRGKDITKLLPYLINKVHISDCFDSYREYVDGVQINAEVLFNSNCSVSEQ